MRQIKHRTFRPIKVLNYFTLNHISH